MNERQEWSEVIRARIEEARLAVMRGDYSGAALQFERALSLRPDSGVALAGLGHCLGRLGRRRKAIDTLLLAARAYQGARRPSDWPSALTDVCHELHGVGAHRESLPLLDRALKAAPTLAQAHYLKGQALSRLHDSEGALRSALRATTLAPKDSNAQIFLATVEAGRGDLATARRRLEAVIASGGGANAERAHFELGRILDRLGEHAGAFEQVAEAGRMLLSSTAYRGFDPLALSRELDRERNLCVPAWRASHQKDAPLAERTPVFLIGFYRSGTTLLEQMLASHPDFSVSGEADLLPSALRQFHAETGGGTAHWTERLGKDGLAHLRSLYWARAEAELGRAAQARVFVDKTALNSLHVGLIRTMFPEATLIFAQRDPRDVCLSCFFQSFVPNRITTHFLDWQSTARLYDTVLGHWNRMRDALSIDPVVVRYEELVSDPRKSVAPVLQKLGLEWHTAMDRFHEGAKTREIATPSFADVTRPLYRTAVGRWQSYAERFDAVRPWLQPHVEALGYA